MTRVTAVTPRTWPPDLWEAIHPGLAKAPWEQLSETDSVRQWASWAHQLFLFLEVNVQPKTLLFCFNLFWGFFSVGNLSQKSQKTRTSCPPAHSAILFSKILKVSDFQLPLKYPQPVFSLLLRHISLIGLAVKDPDRAGQAFFTSLWLFSLKSRG